MMYDMDMMATLYFKLDDDLREFRIACNAEKVYSLLHEIDQQLRNIIKHEANDYNGVKFEDVYDLADLIRENIHTEVDMDEYF